MRREAMGETWVCHPSLVGRPTSLGVADAPFVATVARESPHGGTLPIPMLVRPGVAWRRDVGRHARPRRATVCRFEVDFTNAADSTDHRRIQVNLTRIAVFAGIAVRLDRTTISAEAYATPSDAVAARVVVRTLLLRRPR